MKAVSSGMYPTIPGSAAMYPTTPAGHDDSPGNGGYSPAGMSMRGAPAQPFEPIQKSQPMPFMREAPPSHILASGWTGFQPLPTSVDREAVKLAVSALSPDHLDLFVVRKDHSLYQQSWNSRTGWGARSPLDEGELCHDVAAVSWDGDRIDLFVQCGPDQVHGARVLHKVWTSGGWGGWHEVPGFRNLVVSVAACSWAPHRLDVFGVDPVRETHLIHGQVIEGPRIVSSEMYHVAGNGGDVPGSWGSLEDIYGFCSSKPAPVSWATNRLDVFVLSGDNFLYHKWWDGGTWRPSWIEWQPVWGVSPVYGWIPVGPLAVGIGVCSWAKGRVDLFCVDKNTFEMQHLWGDGSSFRWENLGGYCASEPTAISRDVNHIDVFVTGSNGSIYVNSWGPLVERFPGSP